MTPSSSRARMRTSAACSKSVASWRKRSKPPWLAPRARNDTVASSVSDGPWKTNAAAMLIEMARYPEAAALLEQNVQHVLPGVSTIHLYVTFAHLLLRTGDLATATSPSRARPRGGEQHGRRSVRHRPAHGRNRDRAVERRFGGRLRDRSGRFGSAGRDGRCDPAWPAGHARDACRGRPRSPSPHGARPGRGRSRRRRRSSGDRPLPGRHERLPGAGRAGHPRAWLADGDLRGRACSSGRRGRSRNVGGDPSRGRGTARAVRRGVRRLAGGRGVGRAGRPDTRPSRRCAKPTRSRR